LSARRIVGNVQEIKTQTGGGTSPYVIGAYLRIIPTAMRVKLAGLREAGQRYNIISSKDIYRVQTAVGPRTAELIWQVA
jgi:hypothetical protein